MGTRPREQRFHAEAAGTPLTKISWAVIMSHTWSIWMSLLGKGGAQALPSLAKTWETQRRAGRVLKLDQLRAAYCLEKFGWALVADLAQRLTLRVGPGREAPSTVLG